MPRQWNGCEWVNYENEQPNLPHAEGDEKNGDNGDGATETKGATEKKGKGKKGKSGG